jgi:hypothetical protein
MWQPYVYIWTYKPTGHWYIGSRTAYGCHPKDGYQSSSDIVKEGLNTCREDWEQQIWEMSSVKEALDTELYLLKHLDARNNPLCLNQTNGNEGEIVLKSKPWKKRQNDSVLEDFYLKRLNNSVEENTTQPGVENE